MGNIQANRALRVGHMLAVLVALLPAVLLAAMTGSAWAQQDEPAAPKVDWLHGRDAYGMVSDWVKAGVVPPADGARPIIASDVVAVRVTLRWLGLSMATGDAYAPADAQQADITELARQATDLALTTLERGLAKKEDAKVGAPTELPDKAAPPALTLGILAPQLTASMQIAHAMDRVLIDTNAAIDTVYQRFAPGFHGLRAYNPGTEPEDMAWIWPATSLAFNISPAEQATSLVVKLGYESEAVRQLGRTGGPLLERFEVVHYARASPTSTATMLVRGKPDLPVNSLTTDQVRELAGNLAWFLARRIAADGIMSGTYLPTDDIYDPEDASILDSSLASLALVRWVNAERQFNQFPDELSDRQKDVQNSAVRLVRLNAPTLMKVDHRHWTAAALTLLALSDSPAMSDLKSWRETLTTHLRRLRNRDGTYRAVHDERAETLPLAEQAVIHNALVAMYVNTLDSELGAELALSHARMWSLLDPAKAVSALPWLIDAELRIRATPIGKSWRADGTQAKRDQQISAIVTAIEGLQITRSPRVGPADVVGGFEFRTLPPGTPPHADWTSAYPIAVSASLLRSDAITPSDKLIDRLLAAGLGARFIASLTFGEADCYYVRSRRDAVGGVRLGTWDNRLPVGATAMNLIAVDELLRSLNELKKR